MTFAVIGIVLAASLAVISIAHLLPALVALSAGHGGQALVFAMTGLLTAFIAGALGFATRDQAQRPMVAERLMALCVVWFVVPGFAAIAFVAIDPGVLYADAYFEAVSALTTTGSIVLTYDTQFAPAIMVWRATLQWIGGYASLLMAMVVLAQLGIAGLAMRRAPIPPGDTSGPFGRYWPAMLALGVIYGGVTLIGLVGLLIGGMELIPAICIAFSAAATGGLMPEGGTISANMGMFSGMVVAALMLVGATNYLRHAGMTRRTFQTYLEDPEFRYVLLGVFVGGLVLTVVLAVLGFGGLSVGAGMMWMLSLLSTSVHAVDEAGFSAIPLLVALAVVFVGGSTMSTAGGLKLMRITLLMKQGGREIARLSHPHGIVHTDFGGRPFNIPTMRGVWALFVFMLLAALMATLGLTAFGIPFEQAVTAAIGSLSNAGPVLGFASGADGQAIGLAAPQVYAAMPAGAKLLLCVVMVVGRVEIMAFFGLFAAISTSDS